MASINPMDYFNVGEKIGRVNSPVSGLGGALRDILSRAKSMGLIKAQAQEQGVQARKTALFKQGIEGNKQVPFKVILPDGSVRDEGTTAEGTIVKSPPSPNMFNAFTGTGQIPQVAEPQPMQPTGGLESMSLEEINRLIEMKKSGAI